MLGSVQQDCCAVAGRWNGRKSKEENNLPECGKYAMSVLVNISFPVVALDAPSCNEFQHQDAPLLDGPALGVFRTQLGT